MGGKEVFDDVALFPVGDAVVGALVGENGALRCLGKCCVRGMGGVAPPCLETISRLYPRTPSEEVK